MFFPANLLATSTKKIKNESPEKKTITIQSTLINIKLNIQPLNEKKNKSSNTNDYNISYTEKNYNPGIVTSYNKLMRQAS